VRPNITSAAVLVFLLAGAGATRAQQLEPRAYAPSPVGLNFVGLTTQYSSGGVLTDPTLPIENVHARLFAPGPYYGRTFGLFGRLANVTTVIPYGWVHAEGDVQEVARSVDRSGFADPQVRFGVNVAGCRAMTPREFAQRKPGLTAGASLGVTAPLGQYDPARLINIGTNRWTIKPEIGLAQPIGAWALELSAGMTWFSDNEEFYGGVVRHQEPLGAYQAHAVYNLSPRSWIAADFTYYNGGATTVGGQAKDDRQGNTRGGLTLSVPCWSQQSLRLAWANGVSTRIGSKFQTFNLGWQYRWF
jgi:hypothetical protein